MKTRDSLTVLDLQLLVKLGSRLKQLRKAQGLSVIEMSKRTGISRMTLKSVESGDPAPSIGTYLKVMSALGLEGELALLTEDRMRHSSKDVVPEYQQLRHQRQVVISIDDSGHRPQDLQSLALHRQAVLAIRKDPSLIKTAQEILAKWVASDPESRSVPLWKEWHGVLESRDWRKALSRTGRAQQLRQASPLPALLPEDVRIDLLEQVRTLKSGVVLNLDAASNTGMASTNRDATLTKAVLNAAEFLQLDDGEFAEVLGISPEEAGDLRRGALLSKEGTTVVGERAVCLIRIYQALFSMTGGDPQKSGLWLHSNNEAVGGVPIVLISSPTGLLQVGRYLESKCQR